MQTTGSVGTSSLKQGLAICLLAALVSSLGCGGSGDRPELGEVSGTVTLDGAPLAGVIIVFKPDVGRAAVGETDEKGYYELEYLDGVPGCKIGPNTVSFEWPLGAAGKALPAKYMAGRSELKKDVQSGDNQIDFALESAKPGEAAAPVVE